MGMQHLTPELIKAFEADLRNDEKSRNTIEKYLRDLRRFADFARDRPVDKALTLEYKAELEKRYVLTSANSMLAALNAFLRFMGWNDCCVKQFKMQKKTYCSEDSELSKAEYGAFSGCAALTDLTAVQTWDVSNVSGDYDFYGVFTGCSTDNHVYMMSEISGEYEAHENTFVDIAYYAASNKVDILLSESAVGQYKITAEYSVGEHTLSCQQTITRNGEAAEGIAFVNTYSKPPTGETILLSGKKTWDHGDNPASRQPTSIIVEVYGDGELVEQRQVSASDNWTYSFELTKYARDGHEIVYTIDEIGVEHYRKQIDGYDITNTYTGAVEPPPTGDDSDLVFWIMLMILSLVGVVVVILFGRRRLNVRAGHRGCKS